MIELLTIIRLSILIGNIFKNFRKNKNNIENIAMLTSCIEAIIEVGLLIILLYLL
jgi:hypothetical protein